MMPFDPHLGPTDDWGSWEHWQCPTCGRLFTLPGASAIPWCLHHDQLYKWGGPEGPADSVDWTPMNRLTGGAAPMFEHDCDGCFFLGHLLGHDIYVCRQGGAMPTLVARGSSDGPDYSSGIQVPLDAEGGISLVSDRAMLLTFLDKIEQAED